MEDEDIEDLEIDDSPETDLVPQNSIEQLASEYAIPLDRMRVCVVRLWDAFQPGRSALNLQELPISLLMDAVNALGVKEGVEFIETADLRHLAQRMRTCELLADRFTPFFDRDEFTAQLGAFLEYQDSIKELLIETGLPPRRFKACPWLELQLGHLYDTRTNDPQYPLKIKDTWHSYRWLRYPDSKSYSFRDIEEVDSHEDASFLKGLDPSQAQRLESIRGRFYQVRRDIISELHQALNQGTTKNLVQNCCGRLTNEFSSEEIEFFLEMDQFYLGTDFRDRNTNQAAAATSPGGLSNLMTVIGHVEHEIAEGPFHHAWRSFPVPLRDSLLMDDSESVSIRYLRTTPPQRGQLDPILDQLFAALQSKDEFWRDFSLKVQGALNPTRRVPLTLHLPAASFLQMEKRLVSIVDDPDRMVENNTRTDEQITMEATRVPNESRSGFLGLMVDEVNCEIQRNGFQKIIRLNEAPNEWQTFLVAFRAGESGATKEAWMNGYPGDREGRGPSQVKRRLKDKLNVIGLTLTNGPGVKLTEIPLVTRRSDTL